MNEELAPKVCPHCGAEPAHAVEHPKPAAKQFKCLTMWFRDKTIPQPRYHLCYERELNAVRGELNAARAERDREAEASKRNFAAVGDYEQLRTTNAGLLEAFRPVLALYDEFLEGDANYENAYLCFYKGEYAKWEKARAAIAKATT